MFTLLQVGVPWLAGFIRRSFSVCKIHRIGEEHQREAGKGFWSASIYACHLRTGKAEVVDPANGGGRRSRLGGALHSRLDPAVGSGCPSG